jgi:dTMP kinase
MLVTARLADRGPHNRLQKAPSSSHIEWHHYRHVTQRLVEAGWTVQRIDCSTTTVQEVAGMVHRRLARRETCA